MYVLSCNHTFQEFPPTDARYAFSDRIDHSCSLYPMSAFSFLDKTMIFGAKALLLPRYATFWNLPHLSELEEGDSFRVIVGFPCAEFLCTVPSTK